MTKILVTGGAGYIGSHYVQYENARGNEVVILDNLIYGHRESVGDNLLVVGDVGDRVLLDELFKAQKFDAVVHFAAFAAVGESVAHPERYYNNNVRATLNLLDVMRMHDVKNLIFSSSCATYGNPVYVPMDEKHPQAPINPYGESKYICEKMMSAYDHAHGLRFASLRYFNAAGADPEGRIGESHDPETHIIPNILLAILGKRDAVTVFGTDYDTPDGTCIRDYIHILDLAQAHSLALGRLMDGATSDFFNLGTEYGNSVDDVIRVCEKVSGKAAPKKIGQRRPGDPPRLVASAAKAREILGWKPAYSDLESIVRTAWNWETNRRY
ncbi:MAG: UDP-glucose 4-epimerase GalE [Chthonomonadales bacterium]